MKEDESSPSDKPVEGNDDTSQFENEKRMLVDAENFMAVVERTLIVSNLSKNTDDLAVVLSSTIALERTITHALVKNYFKHPEVIADEPSVTFRIRLRIARALGMLTVEEYAFGKKLDEIRNQFAHREGRELKDGDISNLLQTFALSKRNDFKKAHEEREQTLQQQMVNLIEAVVNAIMFRQMPFWLGN